MDTQKPSKSKQKLILTEEMFLNTVSHMLHRRLKQAGIDKSKGLDIKNIVVSDTMCVEITEQDEK